MYDNAIENAILMCVNFGRRLLMVGTLESPAREGAQILKSTTSNVPVSSLALASELDHFGNPVLSALSGKPRY